MNDRNIGISKYLVLAMNSARLKELPEIGSLLNCEQDIFKNSYHVYFACVSISITTTSIP